jgi:hypothetical protein
MKTLKLDFINAKSYIIGLGETLTHWGTVVLKYSTYTFTKRGIVNLVSATPTKLLIEFL